MSYLILKPTGLFINKWDYEYEDYNLYAVEGGDILKSLDFSITVDDGASIGDLLQYLCCLPEATKRTLENIFNIDFSKISDKILSDSDEDINYDYIELKQTTLIFNTDKYDNSIVYNIDVGAVSQVDDTNWALSSIGIKNTKLLPLKFSEYHEVTILGEDYQEVNQFYCLPNIKLYDFLKSILIELNVMTEED